MIKVEPNTMTRYRYAAAAARYADSLTWENLMEAPAQGTQRKITLASLELVHAARPEVQVFNELLIQYPMPKDEIGQVVPDNTVVVHDRPLELNGSFDVTFQPVGPFWVLEYVSKKNRRKDYDLNMKKYAYLKVPYYLTFYPDDEELSLFHLPPRGRRYKTVLPNERGRLAIPKLEIEVAILDGWARYWFKGELLPLPAELLRDLIEERRQHDATRRQLDTTRRALEDERRARQALEVELARLRAKS